MYTEKINHNKNCQNLICVQKELKLWHIQTKFFQEKYTNRNSFREDICIPPRRWVKYENLLIFFLSLIESKEYFCLIMTTFYHKNFKFSVQKVSSSSFKHIPQVNQSYHITIYLTVTYFLLFSPAIFFSNLLIRSSRSTYITPEFMCHNIHKKK